MRRAGLLQVNSKDLSLYLDYCALISQSLVFLVLPAVGHFAEKCIPKMTEKIIGHFFYYRPSITYRIIFHGVKQDVRWTDLANYFTQFGPIHYLHMDLNPVTRQTSGTGFVDFYYEISANDATEYPVIRMGASLIRLRRHFVQF